MSHDCGRTSLVMSPLFGLLGAESFLTPQKKIIATIGPKAIPILMFVSGVDIHVLT